MNQIIFRREEKVDCPLTFSVRAKEVSKDLPDRIDALQQDWAAENPDFDTYAMGIVGRIMILGCLLDQRVSEVLKPYQLQYSEFDVLATLRRAGSPYELTPKILLSTVVLTSGAMTALLDRLTKRGLTRRGNSPTDGRKRTVILTEKGKKLVDEVAELRFKEASQAISCFSQKESFALSNQLRKMSKWLEDRRD